MEEVKLILQEFGLTSNEIVLYLACLKNGPCSVYALSENVKLPKSTCYDTLKSLQEKGMVSSIIRENKKCFEAADPMRIVGSLEEKKKKLESIIPTLQKIKKSKTETPAIEVYAGKEGIKTILEQVLETNKDFLIVGNFGEFKNYFKWSSDIFVKRRIEKSIKCQLLEEKSQNNKILSQKDKSELRETKFLVGLEKIKSECYIYGDNIAIITLPDEEPLAIQIQNKEIAQLFRVMFHKMWQEK